MICIVQKKMEHNENGRQSSLGLLQTLTALQPQFHDVTLACDDILTIQTHKAMLVNISTVSAIIEIIEDRPYNRY